MKLPSLLLVLALTSLAPVCAFAATFCATTPAQLQAALAAADSNGEHDQIRIHTGTFDVSAVDLTYNTTASESFDLDISGGWTSFFENPCGQQLTDDPFETTLDGGGQGRIMQVFVDSDAADVSVRQLTFLDGHVDPGLGGGLSISYLGGASGTVVVERNVFLANEADQAAGLNVQGGTVQKVVNNLFLLNQAGSRAAAYLTTTGVFGVSFTNNTVISNTHSNTNQPTLSIAAGRTLFANNNFWDNDGYDADAGTGGDRYFYNNNYQSVLIHGGEVLDDNLSVEPEYQGGLFNYTPVRGSPLVDVGREPQGLAPLWYLTDLDLNSSPRMVGPHVDIGAFENEKILVDGFDPPGPFGL